MFLNLRRKYLDKFRENANIDVGGNIRIKAKQYRSEDFGFSKKEELLAEYRYKTEAHAHTSPASTCGQVSPEETVKTYAGLGYNGLVLTNHFIYDYNYMKGRSKEDGIKKYLSDYYEAVEFGKKNGLNVILGAEIRFTENCNDYLVYGIDEKMLLEIYELLPYGIENFRKNYSMPKSVFLQAHPFRDGMEDVDATLLDGIEIFNMHPEHKSRNAIANLFANKNNLNIKIAGSDFHFLGGKDRSVSAILTRKMPKDSFEFAEILKSGDYLLQIGNNAVIFP